MPPLQRQISTGGVVPGGSLGYPSERLAEEVAYIAYHFHWPADEVLSLDHHERKRWVGEISKINQRLNESQ
ncbi:MAG: hypothetical protein NTNFB02_23270 [Nitrospira sp.]